MGGQVVSGKCPLPYRSLSLPLAASLDLSQTFPSGKSLPELPIRLQTPAKQAMGPTDMMTASTEVPWQVSLCDPPRW